MREYRDALSAALEGGDPSSEARIARLERELEAAKASRATLHVDASANELVVGVAVAIMVVGLPALCFGVYWLLP